MTRSASMTPASMSFASSEASLTVCSGTLRTSIGAGTGSLFLRREGVALLQGPAADLRAVGGRGVRMEDGADVVPADGGGDVFQAGDDGAGRAGGGAAPVGEPQRGLHLRPHAAAGE